MEAKQDNRSRLKQVKNLEELVNFRVSTVADRVAMAGENNEYLQHLKKETDPLLANYSKPRTKRVNQQFPPSLQQRAYVGGPKVKRGLTTHSVDRFQQPSASWAMGTSVDNTYNTQERLGPQSKLVVKGQLYGNAEQSSNVQLPKIDQANAGSIQALNRSLMLSSGTAIDEINNVKDEYFNKGREDPIVALQQFVEITKKDHQERKAPRDMNPIMRKYERQIEKEEKKRAKTSMDMHPSDSTGRISLLPQVTLKQIHVQQQSAYVNSNEAMSREQVQEKIRGMQVHYRQQQAPKQPPVVQENNSQMASEKLALNAERVRFGIKKLFNEDFGEESKSPDKSTDMRQPTEEAVQPTRTGKATFMSKNTKSQKESIKAQEIARDMAQERSFLEQISVVNQVDEAAVGLLLRRRLDSQGEEAHQKALQEHQQQRLVSKNSFSLLNKIAGVRGHKPGKDEMLVITQQQRELKQAQFNQHPSNMKIEQMRQKRADHLNYNDIRGHKSPGPLKSQVTPGATTTQSKKVLEPSNSKLNMLIHQFEEEYMGKELPGDATNMALQGSQAIFHENVDKTNDPRHETSYKKHIKSQEPQAQDSDHPEVLLSKTPALGTVKVPTQNFNDSVATINRTVVDLKSDSTEIGVVRGVGEEQKSRHEKSTINRGQNKPSFESLNNNQLLEMLEANEENTGTVKQNQQDSRESVYKDIIDYGQSAATKTNESQYKAQQLQELKISMEKSSTAYANEQQRYSPCKTQEANGVSLVGLRGNQTMPTVHQLEVHPILKQQMSHIESSLLGNQQQTEYDQNSKPGLMTQQSSQNVGIKYESQSITQNSRSDDSRQGRQQVHGHKSNLEPLTELPKAEDQPLNTIVSQPREEEKSNSKRSLSESGSNQIMEMKAGLVPVLVVADDSKLRELGMRASVSTEFSPGQQQEQNKAIESKPQSNDKVQDPQNAHDGQNEQFRFFKSSEVRNNQKNQEQNLNVQSSPENQTPYDISQQSHGSNITPIRKLLDQQTEEQKRHSQEVRGYETNIENTDDEKEEMINGILGAWNGKSPRVHHGGMWHAKRYKRCPRFSIYLQGDRQQNLEKHNYISLNQNVIEFLANENNQNKDEPITAQPPLYQIDVINGDGEQYQDQLSGMGMSPLHQKSDDNGSASSKQEFQIKKEASTQSLTNSKRAFYAAIPTEIMSDPFNKVLLSKGIDNALLTSYRTLSKKNNTISQTLKVIHNKFTPVNTSNKRVQQLYKKAQHDLYPVSEGEEEDAQVLVEIVTDRNPIETHEAMQDSIQQPKIIGMATLPSQQDIVRIEKLGQVHQTNLQSYTSQEPPVINGKIYSNDVSNQNSYRVLPGTIELWQRQDDSTPGREKMNLESKVPTKETESTQRFADSPVRSLEEQSPELWQPKHIQIDQTLISHEQKYRIKKGQEKVTIPSHFVMEQKPGSLNKQTYLTINGHTVYDETEPNLLENNSLKNFKNQQTLNSSNNSTIRPRGTESYPSETNFNKNELNCQSPQQMNAMLSRKTPLSFKAPFYQRRNSVPEEGSLNINEQSKLTDSIMSQNNINGDIQPHLAYGKYEHVPSREFTSKRNSQPIAYGGERFDDKPMAMTHISIGRGVAPVQITQEERAMFRKFGLPEIQSIADEEHSSFNGQYQVQAMIPQEIVLRTGTQNYQDSEVGASSMKPTSTLLHGTSQQYDLSQVNVMEIPPIRLTDASTVEQPSSRCHTRQTQGSKGQSDRDNKNQAAVTNLNDYLAKSVTAQPNNTHDKAFSKGRFNPAPAVAGFTTADSKLIKRKATTGVQNAISQPKPIKKKPTNISSKFTYSDKNIEPVDEEEATEQSQSQNQSTIHSAQQSMNHSRIYLQTKDIETIAQMQKEWQADSYEKYGQRPLFSHPDLNSEINNSLDHPQVMNQMVQESILNSQKADALLIEYERAQTTPMDIYSSQTQQSATNKVLYKATSSSSIRQNIPIKDKKSSRQTDQMKGHAESTEFLMSSQEVLPQVNLKEIGYHKNSKSMQISPRLNQRRSIQQQERNALLRASIASKDLTDMQKIAVRHITPNKEIKVGAVIDHLYAQEKKNVYAKAYVREECFGNRSVIFALNKTQNLGQAAIIKRGVDPTSVRYTSGNEEDLRKRPVLIPHNDMVLLFGQKAPLLKKKDQTTDRQHLKYGK